MERTKKFIGIISAAMAMTLAFTGCSAQNGAAIALEQAMDSLYYATDSDAATAMLGGTSEDIRATFVASAAAMLETQFKRTEPAADASADTTTDTGLTDADPNTEGTQIPVTVNTDGEESQVTANVAADGSEATADPDAAADQTTEMPAELVPLYTEMAEKLINKMQTVATYKIKLMTLKGDDAMLKVSITSMDVNDYFTKTMGILSEMGDITTLTEEDYVNQLHDKYLPLVDGIVAAKEPVDLYVNMTQVDGVWQISDMQNFISQVFQVFAGGY